MVTPGLGTPSLEGGIVALGTPGAGDLFIQGIVAHGDERGRFDDLFGAGWTLVASADAVAAVPADLIEWFESIGGVVATSGPGGIIDDVEGRYTAWLADHGVCAVVQRPDFYVFGSATTPDELPALLRDLRTRLSGAPLPSMSEAASGGGSSALEQGVVPPSDVDAEHAHGVASRNKGPRGPLESVGRPVARHGVRDVGSDDVGRPQVGAHAVDVHVGVDRSRDIGIQRPSHDAHRVAGGGRHPVDEPERAPSGDD